MTGVGKQREASSASSHNLFCNCVYVCCGSFGKLFQLWCMIHCRTMKGNRWLLSIFLLPHRRVCTLTAVNRLAYPKCRLDSVICKCYSFSCLSPLLTASEPALDGMHLIFAETASQLFSRQPMQPLLVDTVHTKWLTESVCKLFCQFVVFSVCGTEAVLVPIRQSRD